MAVMAGMTQINVEEAGAMRHIKSNKGFTLTELIVVVVVFGMIQAAAFSFFMVSLNVTNFVNSTTEAQSEMRSMLSTIQKQARLAERAMITTDIPDNSTVSGWEEGTLVFYLKDSTLVVRELQGGSLGKPEIGMQTNFKNIENLDIEFYKSTEEYGTDPDGKLNENYAVSVRISVSGARNIKATTFADSFYIGNLERNISEAEPDGKKIETLGDGPYVGLVIKPCAKLEMPPDD